MEVAACGLVIVATAQWPLEVQAVEHPWSAVQSDGHGAVRSGVGRFLSDAVDLPDRGISCRQYEALSVCPVPQHGCLSSWCVEEQALVRVVGKLQPAYEGGLVQHARGCRVGQQ